MTRWNVSGNRQIVFDPEQATGKFMQSKKELPS